MAKAKGEKMKQVDEEREKRDEREKGKTGPARSRTPAVVLTVVVQRHRLTRQTRGG